MVPAKYRGSEFGALSSREGVQELVAQDKKTATVAPVQVQVQRLFNYIKRYIFVIDFLKII